MILMLVPLAMTAGQSQNAEQVAAAPALPMTPLKPRSAPERWVTDVDYPDDAYNRRAFGRVKFRLDVDGKGAVTACHILNTSGYWMLDERTCLLLTKRAKFYPAHDANGVGVPTYFASAFWWAHGRANYHDWMKLVKETYEPRPARILLEKMPAGYKEATLVRVRFDADRKAVECKVEYSGGNAALDAVACRQILQEATLPAVTSQTYSSPDTRMYLVDFAVGKPS